MTMGDSKAIDSDKNSSDNNTDNNDTKQRAVMIVDNCLTRAVSKASEHIFNSKELRESLNATDLNESDLLPPAIQIDLVGTRTPSPEEEEQFDWSVSKKQYRFKSPVDQQSMRSTSMDTDISINDFELSENRENDSICKDFNSDNKSINFEEVSGVAKQYVDSLIVSAVDVFEAQNTGNNNKSRLRTSESDYQCFDSCQWMSRIRQVIRQLMRSNCLCKSKEQFRQRKS